MGRKTRTPPPPKKSVGTRNEGDEIVVGTFEPGDGKPSDAHAGRAKTGRPRKFATTAQMRSKYAYTGGFGGSGIAEGSGGNFYSPELSTDFLELPQSLHEAWNYYRFFARSDPFVGQALDLHTELPLSKVRISPPKAQNPNLARAATRFCEKWASRINLLRRLISVLYEMNLIGEVFIWVEDGNPEMPQDIRYELVRELTPGGEAVERAIERADADERAAAWLKKNYKGWTAVRCLPPEQVRMESFNFTEERIFELIPDSKTKSIIEKAKQHDAQAVRVVASMPAEVVEAIASGNNIPLNPDPEAGSFVHYMANKKSDYEARGHSILERCLLPGSLITVLRNNTVLAVPVELVDVATDLLLTHKGRFRKAVKGSRHVAENVTVIHMDGLEPLALTSDHRVLRGADWVMAGDLQAGDLLREAHPVAENGHPEVIDLRSWWDGRTFQVNRRVRKNARGIEIPTREVRVHSTDATPGNLTVVFEHAQDDASRVESVEKMGRLLTWLKSLSEPVVATREAVSALTGGLTHSEICNYAAILRAEGILQSDARSLGRGRGKITTWSPVSPDAVVPGAKVRHAETSSIDQIQVTPNFLYLLGTWFGDGAVWTADEQFLNATCLDWSVHKDDHEVRGRIADLARECFGPDRVEIGNLIQNSNPDTTNVLVHDALLARWFHDEFGHSAQGKTIPQWVFDLPETHVLSFLQGLLDTDGHLRTGRESYVDIQLDNETLIRQLHLLCNRVGIKTQVKASPRTARSWTRRWKTKNGWRTKTYEYEAKTFWRLSATRHDDVQKWVEGTIKGTRVEWPARNHAWKSSFQDGWLTRKVSEVETVPYAGLVYSFDVDEDESLVAGGVVVHNCIRTLVHRDKLRQAQASIASRHMTPIRVVWAEGMDQADIENMREQVDVALQDPDYSIITNFELRWEEMGSNQRLLDLTSEYDLTDRQLYAGLSVTEGLLSGESAYSGDRINLEVINTRYMLRRELIQDFVEDSLFRPMCARMGFIEEDEDGEEVVLVPRLTFTRLALRDNNDTFDALYNLYGKGSLPIDVIYELLNLDPIAAREQLEKDLFTVNDAVFNEAMRGLYGEAGRKMVEETNVVTKIADYLGLTHQPPKAPGRYGE